MTLKDRLRQMFGATKTVKEEQGLPKRDMIRLKPFYEDKPSTVSSFYSSTEPPSFDTPTTPSYNGWVERATKELPNSEYYLKQFSPEQLKELVIANRRGHDIDLFADPDQTPEQLRFIYIHAEFGDDVNEYIHNTNFDPTAIERKESAQFELEIINRQQERKKRESQQISSVSNLIVNATRQSEAVGGAGNKNKIVELERIIE